MRRNNSSSFSTSTDDSDNCRGQVVAELMPRHAGTNIFSRNNSSNSGVPLLANTGGLASNHTASGTANSSCANQANVALTAHNFIPIRNSRLPARSSTFSSHQSPVETTNWISIPNRPVRRNESTESADTISANRYRIPNRQLSVPTHRNANSPEDREEFIRLQQELLQYQSSLRSRLSNSPRFVYQPSANANARDGQRVSPTTSARDPETTSGNNGNNGNSGNVNVNTTNNSSSGTIVTNTTGNSGANGSNGGNGGNDEATFGVEEDVGISVGVSNRQPSQIDTSNYYTPNVQLIGGDRRAMGDGGLASSTLGSGNTLRASSVPASPRITPATPPSQPMNTRMQLGQSSPRSTHVQPAALNGPMAFASAMMQYGLNYVVRNVANNTHTFSSRGSANYFPQRTGMSMGAQPAGHPGHAAASPPGSGRQSPRGGSFANLNSATTFNMASVNSAAGMPLAHASTLNGLNVMAIPTRSLSQVEPVEIRLPKEVIDSFPVNSFIPSQGEADEASRTCSVCLEDYREGDQVKRLPCTHFYHRGCIDTWLRKSTICPICKFDFIIMLQF